MCTDNRFGEHGIMAHIPGWVKPLKSLELHYPRIWFLIMRIIYNLGFQF